MNRRDFLGIFSKTAALAAFPALATPIASAPSSAPEIYLWKEWWPHMAGWKYYIHAGGNWTTEIMVFDEPPPEGAITERGSRKYRYGDDILHDPLAYGRTKWHG